MQRTRRNQTTPADEGFAAAHADAVAARMPPTETERRANQIEVATYIRDYKQTDAREAINTAISQLRDMVADIEREAARPEQALATILYHVRHNMAWKYANISSTLDRADTAIREMIVAQAKIDVLAPETEAR
jgi:hypothetical protein